MSPLAISFRLLGDMDDSNSQTFASGYFSHLQIIKITHIFAGLRAVISSPALSGVGLYDTRYI